jgi:hypothetical protein
VVEPRNDQVRVGKPESGVSYEFLMPLAGHPGV